MPSALSIIEIQEDGELFEEEEFSVESQTRLTDQDEVEDGVLGTLPETEGERIDETDEFYIFEVEMSSKTHREPIYIHKGGIERYNRGYQDIEDFTLWVSKDLDMMYVFTAKPNASTFVKRLKRRTDIVCRGIKWNFSNVTEIENLGSVWGEWRDSRGVVQRVGRFGNDVDREIREEDYEDITTLYIDYVYGTETVQLILSENGAISSKQNISGEDLFEIFHEIKNVIVED